MSQGILVLVLTFPIKVNGDLAMPGKQNHEFYEKAIRIIYVFMIFLDVLKLSFLGTPFKHSFNT